MERQSNKQAHCRLFVMQVGVAMQGGAVWWDPVRHLHANMAVTAPSLRAAPGAPVSLGFKVNEGRKDNLYSVKKKKKNPGKNIHVHSAGVWGNIHFQTRTL